MTLGRERCSASMICLAVRGVAGALTRIQVLLANSVPLRVSWTLHQRQSRSHAGRRAERLAHGRRGATAASLDEPPSIVRSLKASSVRRSRLTVLKCSTHSSCSLSVRMKRSAQPFPSGAVTNDGLERMPRRWSCCLVEPDYRLRQGVVVGVAAASDPLSAGGSRARASNESTVDRCHQPEMLTLRA